MTTREQALEALNIMDDYARMAGVIALGPMNVLRQYIWQSQEPKADHIADIRNMVQEPKAEDAAALAIEIAAIGSENPGAWDGFVSSKAEDAQAGLKKVWVIRYNGVLQPTMYYTENEAVQEVKRRQDEYPHDKSPRTVVPLWTAPTQAPAQTPAEQYRHAGYFREVPSAMSHRLWEQGGNAKADGEVELFERAAIAAERKA